MLRINSVVLVAECSYGSIEFLSDSMSGKVTLTTEQCVRLRDLAYEMLGQSHDTIKEEVKHIANPALPAFIPDAEYIDVHGDDIPF